MVMSATDVEQGNLLHLSGVSNDGHLWHTIRYESGNWSMFADVEGFAGDIGSVRDVDLQFMGGPMHACAVTTTGGLFHAYRQPNGVWVPFEDVKSKAGDIGSVARVGLGKTGGFRDGHLHICGVDNFGRLSHAMLSADGVTWAAFVDVEDMTRAGETGFIERAACAGDRFQDLHICAVTADGNIRHAIRQADGKWIRFEDVKMNGAGDRGFFIDLDCETDGEDLHIFGVTSDGKLWHTARQPDRTFSGFRNVGTEAGMPGKFVRVATGGANGLIQVAAVTDDGHLWHSIYTTLTGKFTPFGDVETQAGDRGTINGVGIGGLYLI